MQQLISVPRPKDSDRDQLHLTDPTE